MAEFPVDPMLAKMIIQSEKYGVSGEAVWGSTVRRYGGGMGRCGRDAGPSAAAAPPSRVRRPLPLPPRSESCAGPGWACVVCLACYPLHQRLPSTRTRPPVSPSRHALTPPYSLPPAGPAGA